MRQGKLLNVIGLNIFLSVIEIEHAIFDIEIIGWVTFGVWVCLCVCGEWPQFAATELFSADSSAYPALCDIRMHACKVARVHWANVETIQYHITDGSGNGTNAANNINWHAATATVERAE